MKSWQEKALDWHYQGLSYKEIAKRISDNVIGFENYENTYQIVRRFIYKYHMRHPNDVQTTEQNDAKEPIGCDRLIPLPNETTEVPLKSTVEYKADGTVISERLIQIIEAQSKDVRYILEAHGFNADEWDIVSCKNNIWSMNSSDESRVNCQSKITVKPKVKGVSLASIDEHFAKMDREYRQPRIQFSMGELDHAMAVVHLADTHLGKLCWRGDTPQDYDQAIARETFTRIIDEIATEIASRSLEYITFVWSNDFFNSDTTTNTTTAGTPMDSTDMRFTKLFNVGCDLLVSAIDKLAMIAPVKTFYISSNHSEMTDYHALQYLKAWFRNDDRVEVNINAYPRKYVLYGNTLLGFTHGGKEKARNLALLMPIEARELWSQSKYAELHCAHLHSEQMIVEGNGVIVRRIASPTPSDNWHTDNGYIGNVRKAQTFVYDKDKGLILTINTPV